MVAARIETIVEAYDGAGPGGNVGILPGHRMAIDQQIDGLMLPRHAAEVAHTRVQCHAPSDQNQRVAKVQRRDSQVVVARLTEIEGRAAVVVQS